MFVLNRRAALCSIGPHLLFAIAATLSMHAAIARQVIAWLRKAAEARFAHCFQGDIVERNLETARRLFNAAALQAQPDGMFNLAVMATRGEGGPKDLPVRPPGWRKSGRRCRRTSWRRRNRFCTRRPHRQGHHGAGST